LETVVTVRGSVANWLAGLLPMSDPWDLRPAAGPGIPRVIHFNYGLWDESSRLPWRYFPIVGSWRRHHPDWRIVLWNRESALRLMQEAFPDLLPTYLGFPRPVQRSDLLRYLLLLRFGGVYADLDLRCEASLERLFRGASPDRLFVLIEIVLSEAKAREIGQRQLIRHGRPEIPRRLANFFLASPPGHPLLKEMIELVRSRSHLSVGCDYDVLYTTGPDVVTEVVDPHDKSSCVAIIDPVQAREYVTHLFSGSWRKDRRFWHRYFDRIWR
jgi:mannosyltransferase OCH1-like enzyme